MTAQTYDPANCPPGLVAVPVQEMMWSVCAEAFVYLTRGFPKGTGLTFGRHSSSSAWNRNKMTEAFLEMKSLEWILYIDGDMIVPPHAIARLLSHNVDIVGATYYARQEPLVPEFAPLEDFAEWLPDGPALKQVQWVGAGCLLVRRRVIELMPYPWWEFPGTPGEGEDSLFCQKARELGTPVHLDLGLPVGHVRSQAITQAVAESYLASPEGRAAVAADNGNSDRYVEQAAKGYRSAFARQSVEIAEQPAAAR